MKIRPRYSIPPSALAKEKDNAWCREVVCWVAREYIDVKLAYARWTAPWLEISSIQPGLGLTAGMGRLKMRMMAVFVAIVTPFHGHLQGLQHTCEREMVLTVRRGPR